MMRHSRSIGDETLAVVKIRSNENEDYNLD